MLIEFLPPQFLINAVRKIELEGLLESDFLLRAIRIKNTTNKPVFLTKYQFALKIKGKIQQQIFYSEEILKERIRLLNVFGKKMLNEREGYGEIFRKGAIHTILGTDAFWDKDHLATSTTLEPNQETGFRDEHFRYKTTTNEPVDELVFTVFYLQDGKEKETTISIPVVQYESKNSYIFPVKGIWRVTYNWDGPESHRGAYSQEFAFDLDQLDSNLQVPITQKKPNDRYSCYGKSIVAIADGEVTDCFDQFPENPNAGTELGHEEIIQLAQEHGYLRVGGGNQVVLKHANGEHSFYAHLIPNSLQVKKGDKVKQGQVLGQVGNSGHSDGPHLHFQLMDGPNKLTARGLPCQFTNTVDCCGIPSKRIDQDRSIIHST